MFEPFLQLRGTTDQDDPEIIRQRLLALLYTYPPIARENRDIFEKFSTYIRFAQFALKVTGLPSLSREERENIRSKIFNDTATYSHPNGFF